MSKQVLILRLSSLGDIILASCVLEGGNLSKPDWLTSSEFAPLLQGHANLGVLHFYDRKQGLGEWIRLCRELASRGYDEVYDLHSTLRTRIARLIFLFVSPKTKFSVLHKPRLQRLFYIALKSVLPKTLRPKQFIELFQNTAQSARPGLPKLDHLIKKQIGELLPAEYQPKEYWAVMPSSLWPGKCWPIEHYIEFFKASSVPLVILGSDRDVLSQQLFSELSQKRGKVFNGVGVWSLSELAVVLKNAKLYFGNDTGLAHLAQSLGTPAHVLFGPTTPDFGFAPWLPGSSAIESTLWCRPCGKDGSTCFRIWNRYQCMKELTPDQVRETMRKAP